MTRIWTGTASVTNGSLIVVLTGDPLTAANCPADGQIVLAGATYFVASLTDNASLELTRVYEGITGTVSAEIDPLNANAISLVTVTRAIADYNARTALVEAYGKGLFYTAIGFTAAGDPGPGKVSRNAAAWADTTTLTFDVLDAGGHDATPLIDNLEIGTILTARALSTSAYVAFRMRSLPTIEAGYRVIGDLECLGVIDGGPADEDLAVEMLRVGEGLSYDKQTAVVAGLDDYAAESDGFRVLVSDVGDGRAGIYTLDATDSPVSWVGPAILEGPSGNDGVTLAEVLAALGINSITVSLSDPTGGADGDLWFKVEDI